jgi:flagellin
MPVISTNTAANTAIRNLNSNSRAQEVFLTQLSSGSRINKSSDDAAGLAVSGQLKADITTLTQSARNTQQGEALLQTADGALARQGDILQRMKSLATQYNSGTVDDESRGFINAEYQELIKQLNLITSSTEFNGKNLIDGTYDEDFVVGIQASDRINVNLFNVNITSTELDLSAALSTAKYDIFKATAIRADGAAVTADTTFEDLSITAPISQLLAAGGDFVLADYDSNGDGDFTDDNDIATVTVTAAATDTIQSFLDGINAIQTVGGEQVFDATLENGQVIVRLRSGEIIDRNGNGQADGALGVTSTAVSVAVESYAIDEAFDDLRTIDGAIKQVAEARSRIGAYTSALQYQNDNINTQIENLTAARSTIVDVDIAEAQSNFTNAQVLTEAATAALAQANQLKTSLLTLLR